MKACKQGCKPGEAATVLAVLHSRAPACLAKLNSALRSRAVLMPPWAPGSHSSGRDSAQQRSTFKGSSKLKSHTIPSAKCPKKTLVSLRHQGARTQGRANAADGSKHLHEEPQNPHENTQRCTETQRVSPLFRSKTKTPALLGFPAAKQRPQPPRAPRPPSTGRTRATPKPPPKPPTRNLDTQRENRRSLSRFRFLCHAFRCQSTEEMESVPGTTQNRAVWRNQPKSTERRTSLTRQDEAPLGPTGGRVATTNSSRRWLSGPSDCFSSERTSGMRLYLALKVDF